MRRLYIQVVLVQHLCSRYKEWAAQAEETTVSTPSYWSSCHRWCTISCPDVTEVRAMWALLWRKRLYSSFCIHSKTLKEGYYRNAERKHLGWDYLSDVNEFKIHLSVLLRIRWFKWEKKTSLAILYVNNKMSVHQISGLQSCFQTTFWAGSTHYFLLGGSYSLYFKWESCIIVALWSHSSSRRTKHGFNGCVHTHVPQIQQSENNNTAQNHFHQLFCISQSTEGDLDSHHQ